MKPIQLFLVFSILLLFSCSPLRHYKGVATDTEVTPEKKSIISPWVSIHFPQETKYVKGDDVLIVKVDSTYNQEAVDSLKHSLDSLLRTGKPINIDSLVKAVEKNCKPKIYYKETLRVDTVFTADAGIVYSLKYALAQSEAREIMLKERVKGLEQQVQDQKGKARNLLIYLIIAIVVALGEAYLLLKPKFL